MVPKRAGSIKAASEALKTRNGMILRWPVRRSAGPRNQLAAGLPHNGELVSGTGA
jgi:hypothetical protein